MHLLITIIHGMVESREYVEKVGKKVEPRDLPALEHLPAHIGRNIKKKLTKLNSK